MLAMCWSAARKSKGDEALGGTFTFLMCRWVKIWFLRNINALLYMCIEAELKLVLDTRINISALL